MNTRNTLFINYTWLFWVAGLVLGLWSGFSVPAYAAPPGQGENTQAKAYDLLEEGVALHERGNLQSALEKFQAALPLLREVGDQPGEAAALGNIGVVYSAMGQPRQALTYLEQALTIQRQIGKPVNQATTLSNIGSSYIVLGQPQEALTYLEEALMIQRQAGDRHGEATTLNEMAIVFADTGQPQEALNYLEQALAIQRELGDQLNEAATLGSIGSIYYDLGQFEQALTYLDLALTLQRQVGDQAGVGTTLASIGAVYHSLGQNEQALAYYQQALTIAEARGDQVGKGVRLSNIGAIYSAMGQPQEALIYLEQALTIQRQVGDRVGEAFTLNNIGGVYYFLSDYPQALDYLQQALTAHSEIGNSIQEGNTLINIGTIYFELDQPQQALAHFQQALPVLRRVGDRMGEANALNHIGGIYDETLGQPAQALDYFQQALTIYGEAGTRQGEAQQLNNIGAVYHNLGQPERALEYFVQALTIIREIGDRWAEAQLLTNIGNIYGQLGQPQQEMTYYQEALPLHRDIGDRAGEVNTLNNLGTLYRELGQSHQALAYFQQALPIVRDIDDRAGEVITLGNLGIVYLDLGQPTAALAYFRRSIRILEAIRGDITVEELKSGFAAQHADLYPVITSLLIELNRPEEAFAYAEQARARAFLDQLGNVRVNPRQGADPALVETEQRLAAEIAELDRRQRELLGQSNDSQTDALIADLQTRLAGKRAEYADLLIQLKLSNPAYAALVTVEPLTLAQIQTEVLAENTKLVSYFVTNEQTIAFVVSPDSFAAIPITVARQDLVDRVTAFRSLITLEAENPSGRLTADRLTAAQALYSLLLVPLSPYLSNVSTIPNPPHALLPSLIIVPHDILHYLPFVALTDEGGMPLATRFTLSLAPSASGLNYAQANQSPDKGQLLALGNPTTELSPLPYADQEVEAIAALYPQQASLNGADATETAFRVEVSGADWVHLAAHAQLNPTSPLFSALYLAEELTAKPSAGTKSGSITTDEDGRLEVHEILNLDLTGVNGVVLSACETSLGEQNRGDELVGLTRAFLYAGTPVVVASLWAVEDEATAALMTAFHRHLRAGLGPAAALHAAQKETWEDPRWTAPYYWAGFQVIGEGGPAAEAASDTETTDKTTALFELQPGNSDLIWLAAGLTGLLALLSLVSWRVWSRSR